MLGNFRKVFASNLFVTKKDLLKVFLQKKEGFVSLPETQKNPEKNRQKFSKNFPNILNPLTVCFKLNSFFSFFLLYDLVLFQANLLSSWKEVQMETKGFVAPLESVLQFSRKTEPYSILKITEKKPQL